MLPVLFRVTILILFTITQLHLEKTLNRQPWFQVIPTPPGLSLSYAEHIWYLDYSVQSPPPKRPGSYIW